MAETVRIALDAMGGDHGPAVVLAGAELSRVRHPGIRYVVHGEAIACEPVLAAHPELAAISTFHPCDVSVRMEEKPSQALRRGRRHSGMWKMLESLKSGEADVAVSAGNTGALMAMSKFCLRMSAGIERPAIAAIWPTVRGESIVLDVGATIGADAQTLVRYALMGSAMARVLFDKDRPTVALLNIGVEEVKGLDEIREAGEILRQAQPRGMEYVGFVEGNDLGRGTTDVVVTEGFTGNIALKTAEGTARQVGTYLREAMSRTWRAKLGYLFASQAFARLKERMDPNKVNGGVFLGLNGIVIKSHGGVDAEGISAAIDLAHDMAKFELQSRIERAMSRFDAGTPAEEEAA